MMTELSLNILDVAENSIRAEATLVEITVEVSVASDRLVIIIADNGCGMTKEQIAQVEKENAALQEDLDNADNPELIEDIAREELGMVVPDEKVFFIYGG